jgi:hypothetical protein
MASPIVHLGTCRIAARAKNPYPHPQVQAAVLAKFHADAKAVEMGVKQEQLTSPPRSTPISSKRCSTPLSLRQRRAAALTISSLPRSFNANRTTGPLAARHLKICSTHLMFMTLKPLGASTKADLRPHRWPAPH